MRSRLLTMVRLTGRSLSALWAHKCFTQTAAISYYLLVSIFPLLLLLIGVAGFFLEPEVTQRKALGWLGQYFPTGTRVVFRENIEAIVKARGSLSILSSLSLLWSGTLMFDAVNEAVNTAWGKEGQVRFLTEKFKSLVLVSILVLAVIISTLMTTQAAVIARFQSLISRLPWSEWPLQIGQQAFLVLGWLVPSFLSVLAFGLAYRLLPRVRVTIRDVWPAALCAAGLWELSKRGFVLYVTAYADYQRVYGSLTAVLILMLWAYVSSLILIWGAELSAEIWRARRTEASTHE